MKSDIHLVKQRVRESGLFILLVLVCCVMVAQPTNAYQYDLRRPLAYMQKAPSPVAGDEDPTAEVKSVEPQRHALLSPKSKFKQNAWLRLFAIVREEFSSLFHNNGINDVIDSGNTTSN